MSDHAPEFETAIVCKRDRCLDLKGSAADRERHVTQRAEQLARAHHAAIGPAWRRELEGTDRVPVVAGWDAMPLLTQKVMVAVMRDLIDGGVLK